MTRKPLHQMQVVKREEKEAALIKFMLGEIAEGRVVLEGEWRIIALSMESPVLAAVRRVIGEFDEASRLAVKVVVVGRHALTLADGFERVASLAVRQAENLRLLDAHEQLVLGVKTSWTGDCMRRNPRERDAFEGFAADNPTLADWAAKAFERIWRGARPIMVTESRHPAAETAGVEDIVVAGEAKSEAVVAATSRH